MPGESLRVTQGMAAGTEIELGDEFVIGRAEVGDGRLGDDPELSRRHARIVRRAGDQLSVEDLGSTNGTYLNGRRLEGAETLRPGDTVKLGTTTLQVLDATGKAPQATAFGVVPEPKGQDTKPRGGPPAGQPAPAAPVPPAGVPPAPPRAPGAPSAPQAMPPPAPRPAAAPSAGAPPPPAAARRSGPPPPPPGGGRSGLPLPALAALGLLVVAAGVLAVVLLTGGDDEPETLTAAQIVSENNRSTVSINTKSPGFDEDGNTATQLGGGTGIVIDAAKGYVLTNDHVVAGATSIKALVENGTEVSARRLGSAPCEDLAVIQLTPRPKGLTTAELGSSSKLVAGDTVTALGFPGAFEADITKRRLQTNVGTISSRPGPLAPTPGDSLPALKSVVQHEANINPGNSGGPLFDEQGEVIGINTVSREGGGSQNQNGAITVNHARSFLRDLKKGTDLGWVGWTLTEVVDSSSLQDGLYVGTSPEASSPADRIGMVLGDRIDRLDGQPVATVPDACDILASKASGDRLKVTGQQLDGRTFEVTMKLK